MEGDAEEGASERGQPRVVVHREIHKYMPAPAPPATNGGGRQALYVSIIVALLVAVMTVLERRSDDQHSIGVLEGRLNGLQDAIRCVREPAARGPAGKCATVLRANPDVADLAVYSVCKAFPDDLRPFVKE